MLRLSLCHPFWVKVNIKDHFLKTNIVILNSDFLGNVMKFDCDEGQAQWEVEFSAARVQHC